MAVTEVATEADMEDTATDTTTIITEDMGKSKRE